MCVCGCVYVCRQLINTSAGINTYKPPDSILGIDLYLLSLLGFSPLLSLLQQHTDDVHAENSKRT